MQLHVGARDREYLVEMGVVPCVNLWKLRTWPLRGIGKLGMVEREFEVSRKLLLGKHVYGIASEWYGGETVHVGDPSDAPIALSSDL